MPEWMERQAEGYAKHLGAKRGTDRFNRIKYGSMRSRGWVPSTQKKKKKRDYRADALKGV